MNPKLKFRFHNTDLNQDEALALLSTVDGGESTVIDLSKVIKVSARSATEMFSLAVKQKNPALANLAAKLAISNDIDDRTLLKKPVQRAGGKALKEALETRIDGPVENIIETLLRREARWAAGVGSILMFAPLPSEDPRYADDKKTLKEIAVDQNKLLKHHRVGHKCPAFRGFANGIEPLDKPGINRSESFFTSTTYNALREGLIFCKTNDLVVLSQGLSVGSYDDSSSRSGPPTSHLQRNYWQIQLSERGAELAEKWGDISDFLVKFWVSKTPVSHEQR